MRKTTTICLTLGLLFPALLFSALIWRYLIVTDNSLTPSPLMPSQFAIHQVKSEIDIREDSITHQLTLDIEVLANISYRIDFQLQNEPEVELINSNHQLKPASNRSGVQFAYAESSTTHSDFTIQLDRPYRKGERIALELLITTDNRLKSIRDREWYQQIYNQESEDIKQLRNGGGSLFPVIGGFFGFIAKADYFIRAGDMHKLAFPGDVISSGEQWHIQRQNDFFPYYLIYGDLKHQAFHWQGRNYHFIYPSRNRLPSHRQQQIARRIEDTLAFFPDSMPFHSPYYFIDFSTNIDRDYDYALKRSMFLNWSRYNRGYLSSAYSNEYVIIHEAVHQWTCAGLAPCLNNNYLIIESVTEYLTRVILEQEGKYPLSDIRASRLGQYQAVHKELRGLIATDINQDIYYRKNHAFFNRLEAQVGKEALLAAIFAYLQQHYDQQPIRMMSNQGLIEHLTNTFPEHARTILFLINHSEEFDFSVSGHQQTDQGIQYQIALNYQEFKHQAAFPTHFSQSLDVAVLTEAGEQQLLSCTLTAEGCTLLVPAELDHTCILLDPLSTYFDIDSSNNYYCYSQQPQ